MSNTDVNESLIQFLIEKTIFKILQILRRETQNVRFFCLKAKVMSIEEPIVVGRYPEEKLKQDVRLGD